MRLAQVMKIFPIHAVNAIIHYALVAEWPPMITQNVKIVEGLTATMDVVQWTRIM